MQLAEMSWTDAREMDVDAVLIPVGSTEQHGPHAALGTDWYLAEAVAARGEAKTDRTTLIAPTIPIGIAEEHREFTGTLWVSPDTFREVVRETVASLASHGWDRIIIVNGHGGNIDALAEICARIKRDHVATCVPFTWFQAIDLPPDVPMGHAGAIETAGMLAANPDGVHSDRIDDAAAEAASRWGNWVAGVNLAVDSHEFTENGVVGDPSVADATLGEALLDEAGTALAELIDSVATLS